MYNVVTFTISLRQHALPLHGRATYSKANLFLTLAKLKLFSDSHEITDAKMAYPKAT